MANFSPFNPVARLAFQALLNGLDPGSNNNIANRILFPERINIANRSPAQRDDEKEDDDDDDDDDRYEALAKEHRDLRKKMQNNEEKHRQRNAQLAARNERLQQLMEDYKRQHTDQLKEMTALIQELKRKQLNSFEDIEKNDRQSKEALIRLAKQANRFGMEGLNIGLFGITSTGKSTVLNGLYGKKVAKTGVGETTVQVTSYKAERFTLWDVPGKNDEISYLSMQYISFFKGLTKRIIVIGTTLKENSSIMKLLDAIGLDYVVVVNKMDQHDEAEVPEFCQKIESEVGAIGLKAVKRIFFVSAKFPQQFSDWLKMVDYLTSN